MKILVGEATETFSRTPIPPQELIIPEVVQGVIRGKTIELQADPGIADGVTVEVKKPKKPQEVGVRLRSRGQTLF